MVTIFIICFCSLPIYFLLSLVGCNLLDDRLWKVLLTSVYPAFNTAPGILAHNCFPSLFVQPIYTYILKWEKVSSVSLRGSQ